jgi:para-nitrobenzyl esterase
MTLSSFNYVVTSATALLLALLLCTPQPAHSQSPPPPLCTNATTVSTSIGSVRGKYVGDGDYVAFRGIPYAQAPVGDLRFEAPRPFPRPTSPSFIRDATKFGPQCIQFQFGSLWAQPVPASEQSEDCLTLNVFAPQPCRRQPVDRKSLRPMLVWMHGGGLAYGSASGMLQIFSLSVFSFKFFFFIDSDLI